MENKKLSYGSKNKTYVPIFVGSTYEDLKDYRTTVRESLHKLEAAVNGMEYFGSKPGSPKEECLEAVGESKIYIGIFAMRYGSIDDDSGLSMTHLEYLEAQQLKLPSLIYIIDENNQPILPKYVETGKGAEKLRELKKELMRKFTISFFTSPDDLAKKVSQDLPPILKEIGISFEEEKIEHEDSKTLIEKFEVRPKKYAGSEIILEGEIDGFPLSPSSTTMDALKLTFGDTIYNTLIGSFKEYGFIYIFAEGKLADKLETIEKGTKVKLKLKFLFGITKTIEWGDDASITKRDIETGFKILEFISVDNT